MADILDGKGDQLTRQEGRELLDRMLTMPMDEQLEVFERVIHISDPEIRRRVVGVGAALLTDEGLIELLRDDADDVRRNAGIEMLKLRRRRAFKLACVLLEDDDPDVVLQAVLVLAHLGSLLALQPLRKALHHPDPNVVQEAILALGKLGHPAALGDLIAFLEADTWVQAAAIEAVAQLGSTEAVPYLEKLVPSPLVGPMAEEALAKIGGVRAFRALARYWVHHHHEMDTAIALTRLAQVMSGLTCPPPEVTGLEAALSQHTESEDKDIRRAAIRCLVAIRGSNRRAVMF